MTGRIIAHASGLVFDPKSVLPRITSAFTYTITASLLPTANVVKLFKPAKFQSVHSTMANCRDGIYYLGDHTNSKLRVKNFLSKLQFSAIEISSRLKRSKECI